MVYPNTRSQLNSIMNKSNEEEYYNQEEAIEREDPTSTLTPIRAVEEGSDKDAKVLQLQVQLASIQLKLVTLKKKNLPE